MIDLVREIVQSHEELLEQEARLHARLKAMEKALKQLVGITVDIEEIADFLQPSDSEHLKEALVEHEVIYRQLFTISEVKLHLPSATYIIRLSNSETVSELPEMELTAVLQPASIRYFLNKVKENINTRLGVMQDKLANLPF